MCDQKEPILKSSKDFVDNENFKSSFARSVTYEYKCKLPKSDDFLEKISGENRDSFANSSLKMSQDSPVRYRKNNRSASMDDSRRFSCGSIVSRRASMVSPPKRNEIPVENIYNQNKIETLQWQLREIEKSRGMYKAVMKQIVTFLEKAHVSLEHLGTRMNRKTPVPRSKSEHHIVGDCDSSSQNQQSLIDEHLNNSWNPNKKPDPHPDEIPPEKLSQEAFRLLRTAQSLLSIQEPNLASSEDLSIAEEPSDIEFLAQLAKEFPSDGHKPQRTTSFNLSPKLILPENESRISTAFNRKLSLQLSEVRRNSENFRAKSSRYDVARSSVAESECYSLPPETEKFIDRNIQVNPLRTSEFLENRGKTLENTPSSPATASISSTEDESGFSSMNSFQDVGLPLVNSTAIDDVSARSVLLKSMLHNNSDCSFLSNDSEHNVSHLESTLTSSPRTEQKYPDKNMKFIDHDDNKRYSLSDVKLWQKPAPIHVNVTSSAVTPPGKPGFSSPVSSQANHQRWNSTPEPKSGSQSLKVLWV